MVFTKEDYRKIYKWLVLNSIKDTQFIDADVPLTGDELIAIVQDGINKKIKLENVRRTHIKVTADEYYELAQAGELIDTMTYAIYSDDKTKIVKLYFGRIPFEIDVEAKTLKSVTDWTIIDGISDTTEDPISYYGQQDLAIRFSAQRTLTYQWADGRDDTQEIEYGVITITSTSSAVSITDVGGNNFTLDFESNIGSGTSQRSIPIKVNVYGAADATNTQYTFTYSQNYASYTMDSTKIVDSSAQQIVIPLRCSSSDESLTFSSISVSSQDMVTSTELVNAGLGVYSVVVDIAKNEQTSSRSVEITVNGTVDGLSPKCIITQSAAEECTITLGTHTGTTLTLSSNSVVYNGSVTISVQANSGYVLPDALENFSISGNYGSAEYEVENSIGTLTISSITSNLTVSVTASRTVVGYYRLLTSESQLESISSANVIALNTSVTEKSSTTGSFVAILTPTQNTPEVAFYVTIAQAYSSSANMLRPSDCDSSYSDTIVINGITYNIYYENDRMTSGQSKVKITIN